MPAPFEILAAVLCDERRTEDNGKHLLIGVYISVILVNDFPTKIAATLWIEAKPLALGQQRGQARVIKDDGAIISRGELTSDVEDLKPTVLEMPKIPLDLQSEGRISFQWKFGDGEWETIKELTVAKRPATQAST
jgi:hypothetical protein